MEEAWGIRGRGCAGGVPSVASPAAGGMGGMERGCLAQGCRESCNSGWNSLRPRLRVTGTWHHGPCGPGKSSGASAATVGWGYLHRTTVQG